MYTPYLERLLNEEARRAEWRMLDRALVERSPHSATLWQRLQDAVGLHPHPHTKPNKTTPRPPSGRTIQ